MGPTLPLAPVPPVCPPIPGAPGKRGFETFLRCFESGCLVRGAADGTALSPPLIVEKSQIDQLVETLGKAIKAQ